MADFSALKRNRKNLQKSLAQASEKMQKGGGRREDDRMWAPTVDKAGNGYAVIRFLPAAPGEEENFPWAQVWSHGFKGPSGQWYIENSLTTIGQDDPVGELNSQLWNSTSDDNSPARKQARLQKRKLSYFSNILVVKDPANPANEGNVFLFRYGKKIFDKINDLMHPSFEDEEPVNPFCMWEGADFKLKIRQVEGYRNYDKSEFDSPAVISDDDEYLEELWKKEHSLKEYTDPASFKTYAELKAKLNKVLGKTEVEKAEEQYEDLVEEESKPAPAPARKAAPQKTETVSNDDDDDNFAFFEKLANED